MYWFDEMRLEQFARRYTMHQLQHWQLFNQEYHWYWALHQCISFEQLTHYACLTEKQKKELFESFLIESWEKKLDLYRNWLRDFLHLYESKVQLACEVFSAHHLPHHTKLRKTSLESVTYTAFGGVRLHARAPNPESKQISILEYRSLIGGYVRECDTDYIKQQLGKSQLNTIDIQMLRVLLEIEERFQEYMSHQQVNVSSITD